MLLVERPNGDMGQTLMRQFLFDAFQVPWLQALTASSDQRVADIAEKSLREAQYHLARSTDTVIALGDGTEKSNAIMQEALDFLWSYAGEMFVDDAVDQQMADTGIAPLPSSLQAGWSRQVMAVLRDAGLRAPENDYAHKGGRSGFRHTEHLGHMLATMQVLPRSHPGATW